MRIGDQPAQWLSKPPPVLCEEIREAFALSRLQLMSGGGALGPFCTTATPIEMSHGTLCVSLMRNGRFVALYEPFDDQDDDFEDELSTYELVN